MSTASRTFLQFFIGIVYCLLAFISVASPSPSTQSVPHPFFFTENKGQWDSRVLYKCNARNGMTWFLERDGVTLLISQEDRSAKLDSRGDPSRSPDPYDLDLPEMMRRHSPKKYPMRSHALKFKFLQSAIDVGGQAPPLHAITVRARCARP